MRRSLVVPAVLAAGLGTAAAARGGPVDFHVVSHSVAVDNDAQTATFSVTFDRAPRFFSPHGGGGGQPQAFQYEVDVDSGLLDRPITFNDIDAVIRGAEIWRGRGLPIREREGDGGSAAGGWGPVRAEVPYTLRNDTVTFTTDLAALGDDDGKFRYRIFTTDSGGVTSEVQGAVIPLPAAVLPGITILGALGVAKLMRRPR